MVTRAVLLFLLCPFPAVASELPDSTARVVPMEEIVVTATRSAVLRFSVAASVSILEPDRIALTAGGQLSAALAATPGVALREYGGNAAVRTVSMRGFGAENVLVLIDGERFNSPQNGGVDFGLVPAAGIDRVEIVRGGQSGLYGADAVGGIINIRTRRPSGEAGGAVEATVGGFGYSAAEARFEGTAGPGTWRIGARRERGNGNFGFRFEDGRVNEPLVRRGADFRQDRVDGRVEVRPAEDLQVHLTGAWADADRGSPGPVTDPASAGRARLYDRLATAQTGLQWQATPEVNTGARIGFRYADERYLDPLTLLGGIPLDSRTISRTLSFQPSLRWTPSTRSSLSADAEFSRAWMRGSETRDALRWQGGIALSGQHTLDLAGLLPGELILYPSLRYDRISDVGGDVSGRLGVNAALLHIPSVRLRASIGRNYRAPTFNELYWVTGGNPALLPERSVSVDAGVSVLADPAGDLRADVSVFRITSRDRIVWLPSNGTYWSPRNIGRVTSDGLEAEARWQLFDGSLELVANSTWTNARKTSSDYPGDPTEGDLLVYTPRQTASLQMTLRLAPAELSVQNLWTSFRYTTAVNDEFLPSHSVTSAVLRVMFPFAGARLLLKLEALNLFDTRYASIALYPMPGRELRGTCGVEL